LLTAVERERKTSVKMMMMMFWVVMLCKLVARDQDLSPEDGDTSFLRYGW
jgi:hypothetical protein